MPVVDLNTCNFLQIPHVYNEHNSLNIALDLIDRYEKEGTAFTLKLPTRGTSYPKPGDNWWEYYFEPLSLGNNPKPTHLTYYQLTQSVRTLYEMPKKRAHRLIKKYIRFKPHIQQKITDFANQEFNDCFVQGVYYFKRSHPLLPLVPYDWYINYLRWHCKRLPKNNKIFVVTNDPEFLAALRETFDNVIIFPHAYDNASIIDRSTLALKSLYKKITGSGNQQNPLLSRREIEEHLFINCALIAQTNEIVGLASRFIEMARQFNPDTPLTLFESSWEQKSS